MKTKLSNFFKENFHKFSFSTLLISIIFSIALFLMSKIKFMGFVYDNNYIDKIFLSELLILLPIIPIIYFLLNSLGLHYKNNLDVFKTMKKNINIKKFVIVTFLLLFLVYIIYYLSLFPGGVFVDTYTCFQMNVNECNFTNQHPVLFTLSLNFIKHFNDNQNIGFGIYTFIQMLVMVSALTYFIYWLLKKRVNSVIVSGIVLLLMFFKLYPLYSISVWKDTYFSLALFMFTLAYIDLLIEFNYKSINKITILRICIFSALTMMLRNNGMIIPFLSVLILLLAFIKNIFNKEIKNVGKFVLFFMLTIVFSTLIQNILLSCFMTQHFEGSHFILAIPSQQIARVVSTDGNITDEQKKLIEKVIPIENIKEDYYALISDKLIADHDFNEDYLRSHWLEYINLYFQLFIQNPGEYFKAYLLQTSGFWTLNVVGEEAYVQATLPNILLHKLHNVDLISELTNGNISFKDNILKYSYFSGGFFFWITVFSALVSFRINKKISLLGYLPPFLLWLTIMASTPMGQALRYVYILVLMMPLNIVLPKILNSISCIGLEEKNEK